MDVGRLKKTLFTDEYFDCQFTYILEIHLLERKFYQKIMDIFASASGKYHTKRRSPMQKRSLKNTV